MENIEIKNKSFETYTDDMVKAIESDKGGLVKKIIHEEEEHEAQKANLSPDSKRNRLFMVIGILLIIFALGILIFLAFFYEKVSDIILPAPSTSSGLIFNDQTGFKPIDGLSKEKISESIFNQINNTKVKIGGIEGIYLTENNKVIGFKRFMALLQSNFSGLVNVSDNFLLGSYKSGLSSVSPLAGDLFILLRVRSFSDIFPEMRAWENKMLSDLAPLFGIQMSSETKYLFTKEWHDGIVENKNARILYDENGNIVLMYVYLNDSYLIITDSEKATEEVILRLDSSKIKK